MGLSTLDLTQMRDDFADLFNDTCKVLTYSAAANSYGEMVASYTAGSAISCGLQMGGSAERRRSDSTLTAIDATLRVPIGTVVTVEDRVQVTHRHGSALSPALTFEVASYPRRGPSGLVLELRAVD